ncbi:MAG: hypothetical protein ABI863_18570 [Ginsengibacter sp.]
MKTLISSRKSNRIFLFKQVIFAFQIFIISLAIPLLCYMELSHNDGKVEDASKTTIKIASVKNNGIARPTSTKASPAFRN